MSPDELASLFLEQAQAHRDGVPPRRAEPNAINVWEAMISDDPEEAWPVFESLLCRISDDEMLEFVWFRLRLLLYRHFDLFHERAKELLARHERFAFIAGPAALDRAEYEEKPFDREALIAAYRAMHRTFGEGQAVDRLAESDPDRGLAIAVEIIHRGVAKGWTAFDLMSPLGTVLAKHGARVIADVETIASTSVAVRRVLWRLKRQRTVFQRPTGDALSDLRERLERAAGSTTDFTERDVPAPPPEAQLDADERIIEGWFVYEENIWAFSALNDLCDEDPLLAWDITLDLINRADNERDLGAIAAGPLETLVRRQTDIIWPRLWEEAHHSARLVEALRGVWVFESDGEVYHRFQDLMTTLEAQPN